LLLKQEIAQNIVFVRWANNQKGEGGLKGFHDLCSGKCMQELRFWLSQDEALFLTHLVVGQPIRLLTELAQPARNYAGCIEFLLYEIFGLFRGIEGGIVGSLA